MRPVLLALLVAQGFSPAIAQQPPANPLAPYIKIQAPVIALTHVRVIDGTGGPAREDVSEPIDTSLEEE